jgi:hypothetical protein
MDATPNYTGTFVPTAPAWSYRGRDAFGAASGRWRRNRLPSDEQRVQCGLGKCNRFTRRLACANPNGISSYSPGLRGTSYPGIPPNRWINPERVESAPARMHVGPMAQSLSQVLLHVIFSTKDRQPFLGELALREEMHRHLGGFSETSNVSRSSSAAWPITCICSSHSPASNQSLT